MPFKYKWGQPMLGPPTPTRHRAERPRVKGAPAERLAFCLVCCAPTALGFRQFCGNACSFLWRSHGGARPTSTPCVACGVAIDLTERGKGGQRRKACTKFCRPCKRDYAKYKLSARELATRDGTDCGICGEPVDMALRRSESNMCASVDHVVPRALGGTHDAENLQLAHLHCNQVKSDLRGQAVA